MFDGLLQLLCNTGAICWFSNLTAEKMPLREICFEKKEKQVLHRNVTLVISKVGGYHLKDVPPLLAIPSFLQIHKRPIMGKFLPRLTDYTIA